MAIHRRLIDANWAGSPSSFCRRPPLVSRIAAVVLLVLVPTVSVLGLEYDVYLFAGQSNMEGVGRPSFCWQQGEEDAKWGPGNLHPVGGDMSGDYDDNFALFVNRVRELFDAPDMPFVYGSS